MYCPPGGPAIPTVTKTVLSQTGWKPRAQQALSFQRHSWPDTVAEMRAAAGWQRHAMFLAAHLARRFLEQQAAYRGAPGRYADPWGAIRSRLGDPRSDAAAD
jgi:hypothetical protein